MKKNIKLLAITLLSIIFIGCNSIPEETPTEEVSTVESPIRISLESIWNEFSNTLMPEVVITAITDVEIQDIIANENNNCQALVYLKTLPVTLAYGERFKRAYSSRCKVIKVEVITNKGSWVSEFY